MYVCNFIFMNVWMHVCLYGCMDVWMYVTIYVGMYACMYFRGFALCWLKYVFVRDR